MKTIVYAFSLIGAGWVLMTLMDGIFQLMGVA